MPPKKSAPKKVAKRGKEEEPVTVLSISDDSAVHIEVDELETPAARRHRSEQSVASVSPVQSVESILTPPIERTPTIDITSPASLPCIAKPLNPSLSSGKPTRAERMNALTAAISTIPVPVAESAVRTSEVDFSIPLLPSDSETRAAPQGSTFSQIEMLSRCTPWRLRFQGSSDEGDEGATIVEPIFCDEPASTGVKGSSLLCEAWKLCNPTFDPFPLTHVVMLRAADTYFSNAMTLKSDPKTTGLLWSAKYTFPLIPSTSHAEAFNAFKNWVRSWSNDSTSTPSDDDIEEVKSPLYKEDRSPTNSEDFMVRVSLRTQEREKVEREAREKALRQNKGYFKRSEREELNVFSTSTVSNIAVLSGPSGLGKSALVEAIAKACHRYIIDIHTGIHRSPSNIEKTFREATQAQRLGAQKVAGQSTLDRLNEQLAKMQAEADKAKAAAEPPKPKGLTQEAISNFFAPKKKKKSETTDKPVEVEPIIVTPTQPAPLVTEPTQNPLVLLDSGDVTFSDEHGFHAALCRLSASSKCPVIVTSNTEYSEDELQSTFGNCVPQFTLQPPDEYIVFFYVMCVLHCEVPQAVDPKEVLSFIRGLHTYDVRRIVNTLQWHFTTPAASLQRKPTSDVIRGEYRSSSFPDIAAMCLNRLDDITWRMETALYYTLDERLINFDAEGACDEEDVADFCKKQWETQGTSRFIESWHSKDIDFIDMESLQQLDHATLVQEMLKGVPRQQFISDGWSVRLGALVERDHMRSKCELGRNKRQRWFVNAAESSLVLMDYLPPMNRVSA